MVERQAKDVEVRGSNPGPGSNFSHEFKMILYTLSSNLYFLSRFLANGILPRLSRQSANKGDNKMILGVSHRSPDISLKAEESPRKPQLGHRR